MSIINAAWYVREKVYHHVPYAGVARGEEEQERR
jgi:hypothetical protein